MRGSPLHLVRRGIAALAPVPPFGPEQRVRCGAVLGEELLAVFDELEDRDKWHSFGVMTNVLMVIPDAPTEVLQAALLHDIGKASAALSVPMRVLATALEPAGRLRILRAAGGGRRSQMHAYWTYEAVGAERLRSIDGVHPWVIAWAAEHHQDESEWTIPLEWGWVLAEADLRTLR